MGWREIESWLHRRVLQKRSLSSRQRAESSERMMSVKARFHLGLPMDSQTEWVVGGISAARPKHGSTKANCCGCGGLPQRRVAWFFDFVAASDFLSGYQIYRS